MKPFFGGWHSFCTVLVDPGQSGTVTQPVALTANH